LSNGDENSRDKIDNNTEHKGIDIQNESCVLDVKIFIFGMLYYITYCSLT